ncbi:TcpQ domain-containing protein [Yersinia massiliensis]|uniref:Secretion system protein PilL n=1 Tax=Yersinia massiliensis TaxID=419257 RepID=A0ABM6V1R9_9GAMM|nr:TcpQ domain-containing protein [Yersinia massiliensis]AVX40727.1 secretion system protein PilL [Yersinia massiliensis]
MQRENLLFIMVAIIISSSVYADDGSDDIYRISDDYISSIQIERPILVSSNTPSRLLSASSSSPQIVEPPKKPTIQLVALNNIIQSGIPSPIEFRGGGADNQSFYDAIRKIAPTGWTISISGDIDKDFKNKKFKWVGNDLWLNILQRVLAENNINGYVNWSLKRISFVYSQNEKNKQTTLITPNVPMTTTSVAVQNDNKNPFNSKSAISKPTPEKIIPPLKIWNANVGLTLHSTLLKWSGEVPCNIIGKWTINWNSSKDYSIDSALTFRGEYLDAVTQLFNLYKKANSPLFIDVYKTQCLIIVSDASENKK